MLVGIFIGELVTFLINVKKLQFIQLMANDTSKTAKITKR